MNLPLLKDVDVSGKKVLIRVDTDVPLSDRGVIMDQTRLSASLPTIQYLLQQKAHVIICGHMGRPKGERVQKLSLVLVAKWYQEKCELRITNYAVSKIGTFDGWNLSENVSVLENLRFYPGEEENSPELAKRLSALADIYVDDAFGVSHRKAASNVGVASLLPHFAGMELAKEIETLSKVMYEPKRPLVVVIGGAKLETKLPLVKTMCHLADFVLVGGKLAKEKEAIMTYVPKEQHEKIVLAGLNPEGTDVTEEGVKRFLAVIAKAHTIVWNGPLGIIEHVPLATETGTRMLAEGIAQSEAYTVVGGGDTLDYLRRVGLIRAFSFVSTGGGAMLAFLSGETLPAIQALLGPQPHS